MKRICVIIVSWNAREFLAQCLESIRATGSSCVSQIIVVDNGSTDGSPDMVKKRFPEVVLIRCADNLGFARANNLALKLATAPILALVNSDVVVHAGCVERLAEYLERHDDVGLVGPRITGRDGALQRTCRRLPSVWNYTCRALALDRVLAAWPLFSGYEMRHFAHDRCSEVEVLSGCFWVARKAAVDEVGGLDEQFFFYMEDIDWCRRFHALGWKVVFEPRASATHYGGGSTSNAPLRYSVEMLRATFRYWQKYGGEAGRRRAHALALVHHALRCVPRGFARIVGFGRSAESRLKLEEDLTCLRWLLARRMWDSTGAP